MAAPFSESAIDPKENNSSTPSSPASNHTPLPEPTLPTAGQETQAGDDARASYQKEHAEASRMSGLPSPPLTPVRDLSTVEPEDERTAEGPVRGDSEEVVDSQGRVILPPGESLEHVSIPRGNLFVGAKPSSPQPWDLVDPPEDNGHRDIDSRKYQTLRSASSRPLKPKSSYYFGPPASDSAYGTPPVGHIGVHQPREILRIERDYSGGELIQFAPIYPLELEGRVNPTQFLESINSMNEILISAHSSRYAFVENALALFSLQLSRLVLGTHYEKEMQRLRNLIDSLNVELYNPCGLNILWPRKVAFLFLEIEYY